MWRKKENHDENYTRPSNQVEMIEKNFQEYISATKLNDIVRVQAREIRHIKWKPPKQGWVKLNTNDACLKDDRAGCGGLIRNNEGGFLGGFVKNLGVCSVIMAELWGVCEGLLLWECGPSRLI